MEKKNQIHSIFGRKGSGKTFFMRELSKDISRIIIFDVTNDFQNGFIYNNVDDFIDALPAFEQRSDFRVLLKFEDFEDYELALQEIRLSDLTNYTLMVDEIHLFASPNSISTDFYNIFAVGRHKAISVICATQRPYRVNPIVRSQSDIMTTFKQTENRDLGLLKEVGFDENEVSNLGLYEKITIEL